MVKGKNVVHLLTRAWHVFVGFWKKNRWARVLGTHSTWVETEWLIYVYCPLWLTILQFFIWTLLWQDDWASPRFRLSPEVHQAHGSSLFSFHARKSVLVSNGALMFCSTKKPRKVKWRCGCRVMVWSHDSWRIHIGDFDRNRWRDCHQR